MSHHTAGEDVVDAELEKQIEGELVPGEEMTAKVVHLQNQIDQLRLKALQARAQYKSLDPCYKVNQLYSTDVNAEKLSAVTKGRTTAFLNYHTLHEALKGSQAVKALKAGLELLDEKESVGDTEDLRLEPEERNYVLELMDEEKELTKKLTDKSNKCVQQEVKIIQMRKDVAENLCKISELSGNIQNADKKPEEKDGPLQRTLKHEEARCNQMRLMIQRLMIGEKNLAQIFDKETNQRFKDMFYRCGLKPEELREEKLKRSQAPQAL